MFLDSFQPFQHSYLRLGRSNGLVVVAVAGVCSKYRLFFGTNRSIPCPFQSELFCLTTVPFVFGSNCSGEKNGQQTVRTVMEWGFCKESSLNGFYIKGRSLNGFS